MGTITFPVITQLSEERLHLYEMASSQRLTPEQQKRLDEINGRLPDLWDQYRRELAAERRVEMERADAQARLRRLATRFAPESDTARRAA